MSDTFCHRKHCKTLLLNVRKTQHSESQTETSKSVKNSVQSGFVSKICLSHPLRKEARDEGRKLCFVESTHYTPRRDGDRTVKLNSQHVVQSVVQFEKQTEVVDQFSKDRNSRFQKDANENPWKSKAKKQSEIMIKIQARVLLCCH